MILNNYWKWKNALANTNFIHKASNNSEMNVDTNMFALNGGSVSMIYRAGDRELTYDAYFPKVAENFNLKSNMDLQFATADGSIDENTYNTPSQISGITKIYHANSYYSVNGDFTSVLIGILDLAEPITVPSRMSFTLTVEWDEV